MSSPVLGPYQRWLDEVRREGREASLLKPMAELVSLFEFTTTLGSTLGPAAVIETALRIVTTELQASRGAVYAADDRGGFRLRASRGGPAQFAESIPGEVAEALFAMGTGDVAAGAGLALVCPVRRGERTIAFIALGPRHDGVAFGPEDLRLVEGFAACAAAPIENGLINEELTRVNASLSVKMFELRNLFEIGRELTTSLDEDAIEQLVITSAMGHFLASRCAIYRLAGDALRITRSRGHRPEAAADEVALPAEGLAQELPGPRLVADLAPGPLREILSRGGFAFAAPLSVGGRVNGVLAVGSRQDGGPYREEDADFVSALAGQAQAAIESARLHRVRIEKERQDRDLEIAREIQRSLFPPAIPKLDGFSLAAVSRSCYQVGGDYYDFIRLADGRLAMVVADVSGKGTPASIMMASVHASLQAMAGGSQPARMLERLNRFLFEKTHTSRYVTLFYGELDPLRRSLVYVDAGHVPPYLLRANGKGERLVVGGPVIGLIDDVRLEAAEVVLDPGDVLGVVTDGVTEAVAPNGEEFGDARAWQALRGGLGLDAEAPLRALVAAVDAWTGIAGCSDDLTILTLRAT